MSVEELVKELRQVAAFPRPIHKAPSLMEQAADKLEELAAALRIAQGNTDAAIEDYNEAQAALAEAKRENEALRELAERLTRQVDRGIASMDKCQVRDAKRLTRLADAVNYIDEANFNAKQELARNAGGTND